MRISSLLLFGILFYSCASQLPPSGGPKDEEPPELIFSNPENKTLDWNETVVQLTFNENIQVKNLKKELLITPTYTGEFDFKQQRESVEITFEEPFLDSTTYTLNFRNSIVDLNESNPAVNLRIAFSTWGYLDSLEISGYVKNMLVDVPVEEVTVGLYFASDTLTPLNGSPTYLSKTNKLGHYSFHNLKSAEYYVYAFNDANNNLLIDSKNESYGFLPDPISVDSILSKIDIDVINLDLTELSIKSARQTGQYFEIKFSKFVTDFTIIPEDTNTNIQLHYKLIDTNRTLKIYNTLGEIDSMNVILTTSDSLLITKIDTLYIGFTESSRKKDEFTIRGQSEFNKGLMTSTLTFSKPLLELNIDSIFIEWDTLQISYLDTSNIIIDDNKFQIILQKDFSEDSIYNREPKITPSIIFQNNAFVSIELDSSVSFSSRIVEKRLDELGSIRGTVDLPFEHYILQLIDPKNNVVHTLKDQNSYHFNELKADKYRIRVIIDSNGNGEWDGGSIVERIAPETIFFFEAQNKDQVITLRANWELVDMNIQLVDNVNYPLKTESN